MAAISCEDALRPVSLPFMELITHCPIRLFFPLSSPTSCYFRSMMMICCEITWVPRVIFSSHALFLPFAVASNIPPWHWLESSLKDFLSFFIPFKLPQILFAPLMIALLSLKSLAAFQRDSIRFSGLLYRKLSEVMGCWGYAIIHCCHAQLEHLIKKRIWPRNNAVKVNDDMEFMSMFRGGNENTACLPEEHFIDDGTEGTCMANHYQLVRISMDSLSNDYPSLADWRNNAKWIMTMGWWDASRLHLYWTWW